MANQNEGTEGTDTKASSHAARRGADVAINCRTSLEQAQTVCAEAERVAEGPVFVTGDTQVPEDVERVIAPVSSTLGDGDILIRRQLPSDSASP